MKEIQGMVTEKDWDLCHAQTIRKVLLDMSDIAKVAAKTGLSGEVTIGDDVHSKKRTLEVGEICKGHGYGVMTFSCYGVQDIRLLVGHSANDAEHVKIGHLPEFRINDINDFELEDIAYLVKADELLRLADLAIKEERLSKTSTEFEKMLMKSGYEHGSRGIDSKNKDELIKAQEYVDANFPQNEFADECNPKLIEATRIDESLDAWPPRSPMEVTYEDFDDSHGMNGGIELG